MSSLQSSQNSVNIYDTLKAEKLQLLVSKYKDQRIISDLKRKVAQLKSNKHLRKNKLLSMVRGKSNK